MSIELVVFICIISYLFLIFVSFAENAVSGFINNLWIPIFMVLEKIEFSSIQLLSIFTLNLLVCCFMVSPKTGV